LSNLISLVVFSSNFHDRYTQGSDNHVRCITIIVVVVVVVVVVAVVVVPYQPGPSFLYKSVSLFKVSKLQRNQKHRIISYSELN